MGCCAKSEPACKDYEENVPLIFNFAPALGVATITSTVVTSEVILGVDTTPAALLDGVALVSAGTVTQWLKNGTVGVRYNVRCIITTSDGRELVGAKQINVISR